FEQSRIAMPLPTKLMLEASRLIKTYGPAIAAALAGAFLAIQAYVRTVGGRLWFDTLRLKIPVLGDALLKAETARFARAMSTLVANTVPLVQCITISAATLNNKTIARALGGVIQGVKRGEGIAAPMRKAAIF